MISRDIAAASREEFDLLVIGGGIYGVSLLQQAARRGLSACLCEAADFGGATSWNSLRIVHGGLRYLQSMDLRRFFQSTAARRDLVRQFPSLVRPLRCLMPLYGRGLKRVSVMRMALLANDVLSAGSNRGVDESVRLSAGEILNVQATLQAFPQVPTPGLQGAASWSDHFMISSERILMELVRDACRHGARAMNYAAVEEVLTEDRSARGIRVRDEVTGQVHELRGKAVVNCAGPRLTGLARGRGGDAESLFRPSLAFNLLLDVDLPIDFALAVAAHRPSSPVLFLVPQSGTVIAGTMHLPRPSGTTDGMPTEAEIAGFIDMLNDAVPGLNVRSSHVRRVFAGLLPVTVAGSTDLLRREIVEDHGQAGGVAGFYSVSGVKFTTANDVARQVLLKIAPGLWADHEPSPIPLSPATSVMTSAGRFLAIEDAAAASMLRSVVSEESVHCVDDLVLRRTNWGATEAELGHLRHRVERLTGLPTALQLTLFGQK